tara:strand:+ start:10259 stop:10852 length:594 start_codon:yes stop_codon:yes gene_type:complete
MSGIYDEEYYNSDNYEEYIVRGRTTNHYQIMADETMDILKKLNRPVDTVLDFGCAVGFLAKELQRHSNIVHGVDVSSWAREEAKKRGIEVTEEPHYDNEYDVVYALDVLEHLNEDELQTFMENINTETFVYKLPVCHENDGPYVLDCAESDSTHKIRWTKDSWVDFFGYYGYFCVDLNTTNIYASEGGFCGIAFKQI